MESNVAMTQNGMPVIYAQPGANVVMTQTTTYAQGPQPMYQVPTGMQMPFLQQPSMMMFQPRMSGLDKLTAVSGVFIKQKFQLLQAITGCEQTQRHFVYALGPDGKSKKGNKIFKCKEVSNCLTRQCCSPHCRSFNMDVTHKDYQDVNFDGQPFLKFERPFKCTCMCLERPVLTVNHVENGQNVELGKVVNPFTCCDLKVQIFDPSNSLKYNIVGSCCQLGVICNGPCCQEAEFAIMTPGDSTVGTLKRVPANFIQSTVETLANFSVIFPQNSTGADRALLIAAAIMMDFTYFDRKQGGRNNANGGTINL